MAEQEQTEGVVVDVGKRRSLPFRKKYLIIAAACLVVLIAGGLTALVLQANDDAPDITKATFNQAQEMKDSGDFSGSAKYAADRYEDVDKGNDRYLVAMQAASSYESNKEYQQAIDWYQKALENKDKDTGAAAGIARSYRSLGDKPHAAEYYQKAIDWYPKEGTNQVREIDLELYRQKLKEVSEP